MPFSAPPQTILQARQNLEDPRRDPLFYEIDRVEEHKALGSSLTAEQVVTLASVEFSGQSAQVET